jgi:hypoxanthine phosphoribosyltransferase
MEFNKEELRDKYPGVKDIIFTKYDITRRTKEIAKELNERFKDEDLVLITVMAGGLSYTHEFMKRLDISPLYFDYIARSSYKFGKKMENPKTFYEGKINIKGKNVAIVDEIVDSGETIHKLVELLEDYEPKSISVVSIISKPGRLKAPKSVKEYYCFEYDTDEFLVGYGLDYNQKYRNLPFIASVYRDDDFFEE